MAEIFEVIMVVLFGVFLPLNIARSYKSRTEKGKSLLFLVFIFTRYIAGIISKFLNPAYLADFSSKWYVLVFYCINLVMVLIDILLYLRNRALDKQVANN